MAATRDIVATYRGPASVMRRIMGGQKREDRALIYIMLACLLVFVAQTPRLARQAFETGEDLQMLLGATLLSWIFIAPLLFYLIAGLTAVLGKLFRSGLTGYGARMALFWALLASTPLVLLWGLVAGFVGPGIQLTLTGGLWFLAFLWFWVSGLRVAGQEGV